MKVLVTGAGGWLGSSVVELLSKDHDVRAHDLVPSPAPVIADEWTCGDLGDFGVAQRAVEGVDAVVYLITASGMDIRTPCDWVSAGAGVAANVFEAAAEQNVARVVIMSSGAVVAGRRGKGRIDSRSGPSVTSPYGLTKWLEERIGSYYASDRGMTVPILRPWLIIDAPTMTVKARQLPLDDGDPFSHNGVFGWVDRSDVAEACRLALERPLRGAPVFHLFASRLADRQFDLTETYDALGWHPRFRFDDAT